jgi:hypothetical protein
MGVHQLAIKKLLNISLISAAIISGVMLPSQAQAWHWSDWAPFYGGGYSRPSLPLSDKITLLLPDDADIKIWPSKVWKDSAAEEGIQLSIIKDSDFLKLQASGADTLQALGGLIMPDSAHTKASDALVAGVKEYVERGGHLMLVYDAAVLTEAGFYPNQPDLTGSRFADMVGVNYALWKNGAGFSTMVRFQPVYGSRKTLDALMFPPGKYMRAETDSSGIPAVDPRFDNEFVYSQNYAISGYIYGPLSYYQYTTEGSFSGQTHLKSDKGDLVAGTNTYGAGKVLFVNLPLGYMKAVGSDAQPLHGFLNLFARDYVKAARTSTQPNGVGGLVYNWHVDDGDDLLSDTKYLFENTSIFEQGPYSIQFTAGPDVIIPGDGKGMDLANNSQSQYWVQQLRDIRLNESYGRYQSHELGSHGGWIHDFWGFTARDPNSPDLTSLLSQNFDAIEKAGVTPIRSYSAPQGNNPLWAVNWLEQKGVAGFYTVGDGGAGVVRSWRNGDRLTQKMWSFPVTPFGKYATFEEFAENDIEDSQVGHWLTRLQDFSVRHRTARLFYNHPPGARGHLAALRRLLRNAKTLQARGTFRWYTMAQLADFSQRRLGVELKQSADSEGNTRFEAEHATSLKQVTWLLPRARYQQPEINEGAAWVSADSKDWVVTAGRGKRLVFTARQN